METPEGPEWQEDTPEKRGQAIHSLLLRGGFHADLISIIELVKLGVITGPKNPMSISIDELGLQVRTSHCLKAENIETLGTLLQWTENQLLRTPNLGRKSVNEINQVLELRGLSLKKA